MKFNVGFKYNGGSFYAGVIVALVYSSTLSPWWLIGAALCLFSVGPTAQWKNDGMGWRSE